MHMTLNVELAQDQGLVTQSVRLVTGSAVPVGALEG
jgi:hypothetical protein